MACRNESYFHRIRSETPRILVVYGRKRRRNDIRFDRPGTRSDNNVNSNARSTDAGASHYLPSQPPPPHNRVKDDFPNESTTVDHDNYTSAIQTTADTSPNYGVDKRLNKIVHDPIFTSHLTLMRCFSDDSIDPSPDPILDRFCLQILHEIHHKIQWLNLESSSMKRIFLAANYPNLFELGLYDIEIETALSLFIGESCLDSIHKNQISSLVVDITKYEKIISRDDANIRLFTHIFTMLSNLQHLSFCPSSFWYQRLLFCNPYPDIKSSTLLELHICLKRFSDCLYLLDGHFNKLHTLHVDIDTIISSSDLTNNNQEKLPDLKRFSVYCQMPTNTYNTLIEPFLQRMSNLEKLCLNVICDKKTFTGGNELKQSIINHMPRLERFEFYICSGIAVRNRIYLPSKEDIQHTFRDFKDDQVISYVDYFQKDPYSFCHIYLYPGQLKYYYNVTNNFPGGLFTCVRQISLYDDRPFEHEFFLRIAESFPILKMLSLKKF
ncbi:unnamed protein product [Rotaria magnacalcarata]|uniref:Uncharacterized protein n=1 Tax=Rotaria magnacalcarata TaxID=392030 RepID=A0A820FRT7_9BILA|nr:unnamed protein product [Rotaria magnacalcarata]